MCSKTYNRAGQQGKSTDSCPEITELHKDYTFEYSLRIEYRTRRATLTIPIVDLTRWN